MLLVQSVLLAFGSVTVVIGGLSALAWRLDVAFVATSAGVATLSWGFAMM